MVRPPAFGRGAVPVSERFTLVVMVEIQAGGMTYRPQEKKEPYLVRLARAQARNAKCSEMKKDGLPCQGRVVRDGKCMTHLRLES